MKNRIARFVGLAIIAIVCLTFGEAVAAEFKMYWTSASPAAIQRANLDGSGAEDLVTTGLTDPDGIAVDVDGEKMYWTDSGEIKRANLDGSEVEDLVFSGLVSPTGIALELGGKKMYWTDSGSLKIQRANLDGSGIEDLVTTGLVSPHGIALDVPGAKMYWIDSGSLKIQRANLDGSGIEDLVTAGLGDPVHIALDVANGKMYWTDTFAPVTIQRANLDGSGVEVLLTSGPCCFHGIAVEVASGKIYWTGAAVVPANIQRASLIGSGAENLVTGLLGFPRGIALAVAAGQTPPTSSEASLTAVIAGTGSGRVTSVPAGINCQPECFKNYPVGTSVTLTAVPDSGSTFIGWTGVDCPGTGDCSFDLALSGEVTATFDAPTSTPTAEQVRITQNQTNDFSPAWDPRGNSETIAYARAQLSPPDGRPFDMGSVQADGTDEGFIVSGSTAIGIAGEHSWVGSTGLLMTNKRSGFHDYRTLDTTTSPPTETIKLAIPGGGGGDGISVSRDGSTVLWRIRAADGMVSLRTASFDSLTGQDADAHGTVLVGPGPNEIGIGGFALTPNGSQYVIAESSGTGYDLSIFNVSDGSFVRDLTTDGRTDGIMNRFPDISPDGTQVAFARMLPGGNEDLFLINLDGTGLSQLTDTAQDEGRPSWSPDGTRLAFQRLDTGLPDGEADNQNIYVINLESSPPSMTEERPDLAGTFTKFKHKVKTSGDQLTVKLSVRNLGPGTVDAGFAVALWLSDDMVLDAGDMFLVETTIERTQIGPGQEVAAKLKIKDLLPADGKFAIVSIDDDEDIDETSEQNNTLVQLIGGRGCVKDTVLLENEPNSSETPRAVGKIKPNECLTIPGEISEASDVDAYQLEVKGDQTVEVTLTHSSDTEFALDVFDVSRGVTVNCEEQTRCTITESGLGTTESVSIDLSVMPMQGVGAYTLDIFSQ